MVSYKKELTEKTQLLVLDGTNKYFEIGKIYAEKYFSDPVFKLASVIVKDDMIFVLDVIQKLVIVSKMQLITVIKELNKEKLRHSVLFR